MPSGVAVVAGDCRTARRPPLGQQRPRSSRTPSPSPRAPCPPGGAYVVCWLAFAASSPSAGCAGPPNAVAWRCSLSEPDKPRVCPAWPPCPASQTLICRHTARRRPVVEVSRSAPRRAVPHRVRRHGRGTEPSRPPAVLLLRASRTADYTGSSLTIKATMLATPSPRRLGYLVGLVLLAQLAAPAAASPAERGPGAPGSGFELVVIHTNDMHSRYEQTNRFSSRCSKEEADKGQCYGGYARVSAQIKQARKEAAEGGPPVLALNAGDTYQGSIYFNVFKWHMAATLTNLLNFDVLSLGNHEFDDGLAGLLPFVQEVRAPVLAANLDLSDAPELQPHVKPSVVLDVNGTRVGVIGYVTPDTAVLSKPERARFLDEITTLTAQAEALHQDGVKVIIALGHSGYPVDKVIAAKVPHVDLVVGGHSHSFLYTGTKPDVDNPVGLYPTFVRQASGREVPVVQAYAYTKYLGRLKIRFDADGEIASRADVQGSPVLLDKNTPQDPAVEAELANWRKKLDGAVMEPLGRTLTFLNGSCRSVECNLGNLVADSLVYYRAVRFDGRHGWTDAAIGMQNGGNIRASISSLGKGTVTLLDVMEAFPFENFLVIVYLRGDVLLKMLEASVMQYDPTYQFERGAFLQFSGLRVTFDVRAPPGRRVVSASARCANCSIPEYRPVDPRAEYGVITNDFLVDGGDGFDMLKGAQSLTLADITPYSAFAEYLRSHPVVFPSVEGRIEFVQSLTSAASNSIASHCNLIVSLLAVLVLLNR